MCLETGDEPSGLSGGDKRRVITARALANVRLLILGDELAGHLNSQSSQEVSTLFSEQLSTQEGKAVVVVFHNPRLKGNSPLRIVAGGPGALSN